MENKKEKKNSKFTQNYTKVYCEDSWNYNAPHNFTVLGKEGNKLSEIHFQEGPIKEVGINGVNNEDLLLMVITRLEAFQNSDYRCEENQQALVSRINFIKAILADNDVDVAVLGAFGCGVFKQDPKEVSTIFYGEILKIFDGKEINIIFAIPPGNDNYDNFVESFHKK